MQLWNLRCHNYSLLTHYSLLHCPLFSDERLILMNNIRNIDNNILNLNDSRFSEVFFFGNCSFNNTKNRSILKTTIKYIVSSKRFEVPLFDSSWHGCFIYLLLFIFISFSSFKFSYFHCAISHYCWLSIYTFLSCNFWIWFLV